MTLILFVDGKLTHSNDLGHLEMVRPGQRITSLSANVAYSVERSSVTNCLSPDGVKSSSDRPAKSQPLFTNSIERPK